MNRVTKRIGGKVKKYTNLATFNKECPSRGYGGNLCTVTNIRCTKRGEGLATVKTDSFMSRPNRPPGTWLLHFASCTVMKNHLQNRAGYAAAIKDRRSGPFLSGARRKRRRR